MRPCRPEPGRNRHRHLARESLVAQHRLDQCAVPVRPFPSVKGWMVSNCAWPTGDLRQCGHVGRDCANAMQIVDRAWDARRGEERRRSRRWGSKLPPPIQTCSVRQSPGSMAWIVDRARRASRGSRSASTVGQPERSAAFIASVFDTIIAAFRRLVPPSSFGFGDRSADAVRFSILRAGGRTPIAARLRRTERRSPPSSASKRVISLLASSDHLSTDRRPLGQLTPSALFTLPIASVSAGATPFEASATLLQASTTPP